MAENTTKPTDVDVEDFLATVSGRRASEARMIIDIMQRITGQSAVMWGPSIIGFGSVHFVYESGREGDAPLLGFSPRKTNLTFYFMEGFDRYRDELARLGAHKTAKSCLYVSKLESIDIGVLTAMLEASYDWHTKDAQ